MKFTMLAASVAVLLAMGQIAETKELRLSAAPPAGSPWGKITLKFVDKVAKVSGGKLTIKPFLGSKLGGEQDVVRQVARGRIDIAVASNTGVSLLVPEFGLLASPYAFDSAKQFDCVADNHLLGTFGDNFDAAGIKAISWMEVGYQVIFSKKPLRTPSDLVGVKVRTAPAPTDTLFIQTAGATAVPLAPKDAVPAMKTGQVSAATQLSVFGIATGYDKVGPNITMTRHQHQVGSVIVSAKTWNKLTDQEKAWINAAAPIFLELRGAIRGAEGALLSKAQGGGATIINLSDGELAQWKALVPAAQKAILNELGGGAAAKWKQILAAKDQCS